MFLTCATSGRNSSIICPSRYRASREYTACAANRTRSRKLCLLFLKSTCGTKYPSYGVGAPRSSAIENNAT